MMDHGCYTLSFQFPTMNINSDNNNNTSSNLSEATTPLKPTGKRTHPVTTDRRKKIILPSLSSELPARIYRKSNRLQFDKNNAIKSIKEPFVQPLFIQINEDNIIDNRLDSSFLSSSNRGNVLLRTITTHSEKFSRKKQQQQQQQKLKPQRISFSGMPTIPTKAFIRPTIETTTITKDSSATPITRKEFVMNSLNKPRVTSAQILLQSLEGKRMSCEEKVNKWLNQYCQGDENDSSVDQDTTEPKQLTQT